MMTLSSRGMAWIVVLAALVGGVAGAVTVPPIHLMAEAGAIKTWTTGETLTASDLNAAFSHLHSLMVGGHGGRLVDADVSASASISTSKLAGYRNVPVAWGYVGATCAASPCTIIASGGTTSVTRTGTGIYVVTMSSTRTNTSYAALVTPVFHTGAVETLKICSIVANSQTTTTFGVECLESLDGATYANAAFGWVVYDND